jgi:Xaa-Pro aminopeptidase
LGFEVLTFAPIDRGLIDKAMLSESERVWVNSYHEDVARVIGPQLKGDERSWLENATRAI